jgi:hypothetical protein
MRRLRWIATAIAATALLAAAVASAGPRQPNGMIAFARFDPALDDTQVYVVNPDGAAERRISTDPLECPRWSPDSTRISTCGDPTGAATRIVNPDDGSYRIIPMTDPDRFFLPCSVWSRDGSRLYCEGFGVADDSLNGIYSIRSSDGHGLARVTSTPGGDDIPSDASPDGNRLVFHRTRNDSLDVVNANGTGLEQITPDWFGLSSDGAWSPQGNEIIFSRHATPDARSSLWIVHADGTGLRRVDVHPAGACGGLIADPSSQGCFQPRWSPDGTKIVFARGTSGDFDSRIYVVGVDGSGLTQITHGTGDQSPDWGTHA